jgi:hypothetical protein
MSRYAVFRTWAGVLKLIGIVGMILATFGVISWAIDVDGQALGAIADIGDSVAVQSG